MQDIQDHLREIQQELPPHVQLIAVSKTRTPEEILEAYAAGIRDFGENKVQELVEKYEALPKDIRWHFIGSLQTNKVRKLMGKTFLIQSLDRWNLALELEKRAGDAELVLDVLLEVNIGEEPQKGGIIPSDLPDFIEKIKTLSHLRVRGLMAIIPQGSEAENRVHFQNMNTWFEKLKNEESERFTMEILSMGMSMDYKTAVEEGSTMIRVGTSIFGQRNNA